jgi:hypothetical protein
MHTDSIVQAVRKVRQDHLQQFAGDTRLAFQDIVHQREALQKQGWVFHTPKRSGDKVVVRQ